MIECRSTRKIAWAVLALLAASATVASGDLFDTPLPYAAAHPTSIVPVDLNGDGHLDIAAAVNYADGVSVFLGNGDGTMCPGVVYPAAVLPVCIATGDFNADGHADLVVSDSDQNEAAVLLGNGDGTLQPVVAYDAGDAVSVAGGDFDGDGALDLAVANEGTDEASVLLGNGDGTFHTRTTWYVGDHPNWITVGDCDNDGVPDLIVVRGAYLDQCYVTVLLGAGDGTFGTPISRTAGHQSTFVTAGELNSDGNLDLVVANDDDDDVSVLLGGGDGTFALRSDYYAGQTPTSAAIGDIDLDGNPDIVATNGAGNDFCVRFGDGTGGFGDRARLVYPSKETPRSAVIGDFDEDGDPDVATANLVSDEVCVFLNEGGSFPSPNYYMNWRPTDLALADCDGDGVTDVLVANSHVLSCGFTIRHGNGDGTFGPLDGFGMGEGCWALATGDLNSDDAVDVVIAAGEDFYQEAGVVVVKLGPDFVTTNAYDVGCYPRSVLAEDIDLDGILDVAVANYNSDDVSVFLGNGDGTLSEVADFQAGEGPMDLAVADLNADGKSDLVVANDISDDISVLMGRTTGYSDRMFDSPYSYATGNGPRSVVIEDLDGDGIADLVVANEHKDSVSVLIGSGDGSFASPTQWHARDAYSVAVGDLNGDGCPDLAVTAIGAGVVSVLLGNGDGTFQPRLAYWVNNRPVSVALADLDGDDDLDVVVACDPDFEGGGYATVLLNRLAPTGIPGDSGEVNASARLLQNSPNPFNPETAISFVIPAGACDVELSIYSVSGALIERWNWRAPIPGLAHVRWDGRSRAGARVASGVYFYRLSVDGQLSTRKMVLLK